jgi:hypothetical protein
VRCDLHCPKSRGGLVASLIALGAVLGAAYWVIATLFVFVVLAGVASIATLAGVAVYSIREQNRGALPLDEFNRRRALANGIGSTELISSTPVKAIEVPITVKVINELGQEVSR